MSRRRTRNQAGAVTPMLVILVVSLMAVAALSFDGARLLAERRTVADVAAQAAQAGTSGLDRAAARTPGAGGVDPVAAAQRASEHLSGGPAPAASAAGGGDRPR